MKKSLAVLLAGILLLGAVCAAAEETAPVISYGFNLRFEINPQAYAFRERQHIQGYADLLDLLEVKGTMARCPETKSADVRLEVVPKTNPAAEVAVRLYGTSDMMRIESPLLGNETVCFRPSGLMAFCKRAWEAFKAPLPQIALLIPDTTVNAFRCLVDVWNEQVGPVNGETTISNETVETLAKEWYIRFFGWEEPKIWINAVTGGLEENESVWTAAQNLYEIFQQFADGKALQFTEEKNEGGETLRLTNDAGETLFTQNTTDNSFDFALTVPELPVDYIPSVAYQTETKDGKISLSFSADWNRGPGTGEEDPAYRGEWPESMLSARVEMEGLPSSWPADSEFSGRISIEGYMLPNFSYLIRGTTTDTGSFTLSLARAGDPVFTVTGSVVPVDYAGSLAYVTEEMETAYNIFGLNEDSLHALVNAVDRPLLSGLIDFLYELPASSCQSIMDDLESFSLVQTLLN